MQCLITKMPFLNLFNDFCVSWILHVRCLCKPKDKRIQQVRSPSVYSQNIMKSFLKNLRNNETLIKFRGGIRQFPQSIIIIKNFSLIAAISTLLQFGEHYIGTIYKQKVVKRAYECNDFNIVFLLMSNFCFQFL